jgi:DNA polymerase III epsilon subunit-like protein
MNYIIFDLEFNQQYSKDKSLTDNTKKGLLLEIIQIGALKLNNNFETVSIFNSLINPTIHTIIHPYIENLTGITNGSLISSKTFPEVYKDFLEFIGDNEAILCVWGTSDIKELIKNVRFHNLSYSSLAKKYIDIQSLASKHFYTPKGSKISLKNAIELLNINITGEFHDAYNDAYYTAEIFKILYNSSITPLIYNFNISKRHTHHKEKINLDGLIEQFEKMYNRQMSKDEIDMIKLAYNMGRTKQFIIT